MSIVEMSERRVVVAAPSGETRVLTAQSIFDYVYKFIMKQGKPAIDASGKCAYRTTDHEGDGRVLCCAAGCLLTDEEAFGLDSTYNVDKGQYTTLWQDVVAAGKAPARFAEFTGLICAIQRAHDGASTIRFASTFTKDMRSVAIEFELREPKL